MFEVNSVVNKTNTLTSATSKKSGIVLNTFKCLPIKFDKPDLEKPKASAIPPTRQVRQSREVLPYLEVVGLYQPATVQCPTTRAWCPLRREFCLWNFLCWPSWFSRGQSRAAEHSECKIARWLQKSRLFRQWPFSTSQIRKWPTGILWTTTVSWHQSQSTRRFAGMLTVLTARTVVED